MACCQRLPLEPDLNKELTMSKVVISALAIPFLFGAAQAAEMQMKPIPDRNLPFEQLTPQERHELGVPQDLSPRALSMLRSGFAHAPAAQPQVSDIPYKVRMGAITRSAPPGHGTPPPPNHPPPPVRPLAPFYSTNWSGFAIAPSAQWPGSVGASSVAIAQADAPSTLTSVDGKNDWISKWAGLDGFGVNGVVNQGGILGNTDGFTSTTDGSRHPYISFFECFPGPTIPITFVEYGDQWSVEVSQGTFIFMNFTSGEYLPFSTGCTTPGASVEWIDEAPEVDGAQSVLAYHSPDDFHGASAVASSGENAPGSAAARKVILVNSTAVLNTPRLVDVNDFNTFSYGDQ
jgi:hypothetical protein